MLEELFPTSDKSLIKLTAEQIRTTKQLLITTAELKPKADLIDYLSARPGALKFQEMAQLLKMSKAEFEYKLKRLRILKPIGRREVYSDYNEFPSGKAHSFRGGMKARQDAECQ